MGAEELRGVNPYLILRGSFVRRVLDLAARRDAEKAAEMVRAMRALASIVLAADEVRLAREVLEGGRFAAVKAVELAERLLAAEEGHTPPCGRAGRVVDSLKRAALQVSIDQQTTDNQRHLP